MKHAVGRVLERLGRGLVDRARAERAAEDQDAGLLLADAELRAGVRAVGDLRRDRATGDQVPIAGAALDREREADAAGSTRQRAVGDAEMAVGLAEHERRPG